MKTRRGRRTLRLCTCSLDPPEPQAPEKLSSRSCVHHRLPSMGRGRAVRRAAALLKQATHQGAAQTSNAVPVFDVGASCMGARCFVTALARRNPGEPRCAVRSVTRTACCLHQVLTGLRCARRVGVHSSGVLDCGSFAAQGARSISVAALQPSDTCAQSLKPCFRAP